MAIDSIQIQYFLEVAKHLNFTKAANNLYVSQPAISRKVAALEKELGCILIDRTNKSIELTEAGKSFQLFFTRYLRELEEEILRASKLNNESGSLCIGVFNGWDLSRNIRPILSTFNQRYGNIVLSVKADSEDALVKGLKHGKYDVVFALKTRIEAAVKTEKISSIDMIDVLKVKKLLLFSRYNRVLEKGAVHPKDFEGQFLYTLSEDDRPLGFRTNEQLLKEYGLQPRYKNVSSMDNLALALGSGDGYTIVDTMVRESSNSEFAYLELDGYNTISMAVSRLRENKHKKLFLNHILTGLEEVPL